MLNKNSFKIELLIHYHKQDCYVRSGSTYTLFVKIHSLDAGNLWINAYIEIKDSDHDQPASPCGVIAIRMVVNTFSSADVLVGEKLSMGVDNLSVCYCAGSTV